MPENEFPAPETLIEPAKVSLQTISQQALLESRNKHQLIDNKFSKAVDLFTTIKPLEKLIVSLKSRPELRDITAAQFLTDPQFETARHRLSPAANSELINALQQYSDDFNLRVISDHSHDEHAKYEQLANESGRDSLTGLIDRKGFRTIISHINKVERRHNPEDIPAWQGGGFCIMIDIDDFKEVNDAFGHGIGDINISTLAESIIKRIREDDDLVVRVGGEEFLILLGDTVKDIDFDDEKNLKNEWIKLVEDFHKPSANKSELLSKNQQEELIEAINDNHLNNTHRAWLRAMVVINKVTQIANGFVDDQIINDELRKRLIMKTISAGIGAYQESGIDALAQAAGKSEKDYNDQLAKFYQEADYNLDHAKKDGKNGANLNTLLGGIMLNYAVRFPTPPTAAATATPPELHHL